MTRINLVRAAIIGLAVAAFTSLQAAPTGPDSRPGSSGGPKITAFIAFGDSLSDVGNDFILTSTLRMNPAIPPSVAPHRTYYEGRFSNGRVAIEHLWQLLNPGAAPVAPLLGVLDPGAETAISFAFGGSGSGGILRAPGGFAVPGALTQVETYSIALRGRKANRNALYVVWTGANDYILYGANDPGPVVANIATAIRKLYALGARQFLVPDLPDMGMTPLIRMQGLGDAFSLLTKQHNMALAGALDGLAATLSGARFVRVDTNAILGSLLNNGTLSAEPPGLELVAPGSGAVDCLFRDVASCPDAPSFVLTAPVLFWDALHPTTLAHRLLADAMFARLR